MMKKIFLVLILMIVLTGCVLPNDTEFMEVAKKLNTPYKICNYMEVNFTYEQGLSQEPFELWQSKRGSCSDFASFGTYIANYHGYETYIIGLALEGNSETTGHAIAVYVEHGRYNFSDNWLYFPVQVEDIKSVVEFYHVNNTKWEVIKYAIFDYKMNMIGEYHYG